MRSLEELANTSTDEIADLIPKLILDKVEEAARARRFGRNLVKINEDLVKTKGRSIVVGRRGTVTAQDVEEGKDISSSAQGIAYTGSTIVPTKKGVPVHITQEAIDGAELNLIEDTVTEAGIALADKEDLDIMEALLKYTVDTVELTSGATADVGSALVYVDETNAAVDAVDYAKGKILASADGTVDVYTTDYTSDNITDALANGDTWNVNAYGPITDAVAEVRGRKWTPNFLVVDPSALSGILKSDMFIDAAKYGSNEQIVNGEIGKVGGLKVLTTTNMPAGAALVIDSERASWMAVKRKLDMKRWDNPQTDSIELYFYVEYGIEVTDADALQLILNITKKSVSL